MALTAVALLLLAALQGSNCTVLLTALTRVEAGLEEGKNQSEFRGVSGNASILCVPEVPSSKEEPHTEGSLGLVTRIRFILWGGTLHERDRHLQKS